MAAKYKLCCFIYSFAIFFGYFSKIIELAKELLLNDKGINIIYCTLQHIVNHLNISNAFQQKVVNSSDSWLPEQQSFIFHSFEILNLMKRFYCVFLFLENDSKIS